MGWTGSTSWKTAGDVRKAILRECYDAATTVLRTAPAKGTLWVLAQPKGGAPRIDVFLVEKNCGLYGYKSMSEVEGPYDVEGCPLDFLDLAPETCPEWRVRVREFHTAKERTFAPEDLVTVHGHTFTVVGRMTGKGGRVTSSYLIRAANGKVYRSTPANMVPVSA